ncbi:hypothetical protein Tco_0749535 [Tanacetum coccineum]|uniref:Uncharacterized protein n=1 Tax=Tanacetum coccineum TaxID=301880 RepID=A0ABQ4YYS5_9ASTR
MIVDMGPHYHQAMVFLPTHCTLDGEDVIDLLTNNWVILHRGTKKYRGSNSSDGGNIEDGVKIAGGVIGSGDEIESSEELKEMLPDEAGK